jgi:hypothetical protein
LTPGSGIRNGPVSDPGSEINIPDPQHCPQAFPYSEFKFFLKKHSIIEYLPYSTFNMDFVFRNDAQACPHGELQHLGAGAHPPLPNPGL